MVSCTDCIHYNACKMWHHAIDVATDSLNELYDRFNGFNKTTWVAPLEHVEFPGVAETKEDLCEHYEKAKVK